MKIDDSDMNLVEMTERALSSFKNTNFFTVKIKMSNKIILIKKIFFFPRMTRKEMVRKLYIIV